MLINHWIRTQNRQQEVHDRVRMEEKNFADLPKKTYSSTHHLNQINQEKGENGD